MPKKPPVDPQSCASCRCYVADPGDEVGFCKRYPPVALVVTDEIRCAYPVVSLDDICGEFAQRLQS